MISGTDLGSRKGLKTDSELRNTVTVILPYTTLRLTSPSSTLTSTLPTSFLIPEKKGL